VLIVHVVSPHSSIKVGPETLLQRRLRLTKAAYPHATVALCKSEYPLAELVADSVRRHPGTPTLVFSPGALFDSGFLGRLRLDKSFVTASEGEVGVGVNVDNGIATQFTYYSKVKLNGLLFLRSDAANHFQRLSSPNLFMHEVLNQMVELDLSEFTVVRSNNVVEVRSPVDLHRSSSMGISLVLNLAKL